MKKLILFISFVLSVLFANAQQDPMFTQYMFDKMLVNPAYVGSSNWIVATAKYRTQFVSVPGAPQTTTFTFHAPIQKKNLGVGLKFISDKTAEGAVSTNWFTLNAAYHLKLKESKLSFGLEGGILNKSANYANLIKYDPNDDNIPNGENVFMPDVSFGTYFQTNKLYAGLSLYHLLPNSGKTGDARLNKHYLAFVGNVFDIVDKKFAIDPSLLLKYVGSAPAQVDLNVNFVYLNRFTAGASWRTGDAFAVLVKADITEQIRVAYSYDVNTSGLSTFSSGGHEILLSYGIKILPPPALKDIHPRYYF